MQTALPVLLTLTYPGTKTSRSSSSLAGVLMAQNRYTVFAPLALALTINAANLLYISPQTTKVMKQRKHQGSVSPPLSSPLVDSTPKKRRG